MHCTGSPTTVCVWHGMFDREAATQLAAILLGLAGGLVAIERLDILCQAAPNPLPPHRHSEPHLLLTFR